MNHPVGLIYHDVAAPGECSGFHGVGADHYRLTPARFQQHLTTIAACGVRPARVTDAAGPEGERSVYLTFDDGGHSAAATIGPALSARGWTGHFFITTGRIGEPGFVTETEVRELAEAGHVVGSHSHTHPVMTRLSDEEIADEWVRSRRILEEILCEAVTTLSVPTGFSSERVIRPAIAAGYTHLFTSEPWLRPRVRGAACIYGRFSITAGTAAGHLAALCRADPLAVARDAAGWEARKLAKRWMGPVYAGIRRALLLRRAG